MMEFGSWAVWMVAIPLVVDGWMAGWCFGVRGEREIEMKGGVM